jgi:hypothetical protein
MSTYCIRYTTGGCLGEGHNVVIAGLTSITSDNKTQYELLKIQLLKFIFLLEYL